LDYNAQTRLASPVASRIRSLYNNSMANLMNKLNTLVRSSVNNVLRNSPDRQPRQVKPGKNVDREVSALRQQIEKALGDEDRLTADIQALQNQIADWNQQADRALTQGDEATARYAIRQMKLQEQRVTLLEADLAQHRISTSDLIHRVNELEAALDEARRRQQEAPPVQAGGGEDEALSARLRKIRPQVKQVETSSPAPLVELDEKTVDDDLAHRRARLSKPD
jgi:chromosome segregation ATPase